MGEVGGGAADESDADVVVGRTLQVVQQLNYLCNKKYIINSDQWYLLLEGCTKGSVKIKRTAK